MYRDRFYKWYSRWSVEAFGLDLRSLALLRVGYGVLILVDLVVRASALEAHYTDRGVLPLNLWATTGIPLSFSLHALSGSLWFQAFLFLLNALAAVALVMGYRTRVATACCWLLLLSLHNRNFLILNGGDTWMRLTLMWALFLPWGERWSLDAKRTREPEEGNYRLSGATLGLVLQVFTVYFLAGLFKSGEAWMTEGSAVFLSMALSEWTGEWAYYALFFPSILKGLTFTVLAYELIGPFLFFTPFWTQKIRTFVVLGFMGFHLGLAAFLEIGLFPYIGVVSAAALLPSWFWDNRWMAPVRDRITRFFRSIPSSWDTRELREPWRLHPVTQWFLIGLTGYSLFWNLGTWAPSWGPSPALQAPGHLLRVDQYWGLFAPEPPRNHNWFLAVAELESGEKVDLIRNKKPVDWDVPTSSAVYLTQRWKRYYFVESTDTGAYTREAFIRYLYRRWSTLYPDIQSIELFRMYQASTLNFEEAPAGKQSLLKRRADEL